MKKKLEDFGELSAALQKIVDGLDSGEPILLHNGLPPDEPDAAYDVPAEFIRFLALGGCEGCGLHEKGLQVIGARITGTLDLEGCELPRDLGLFACRFEGAVSFQSAKVQNLFLSDSLLPKGLQADRLEAKGGAFLREVEAHREVRLLGAKLGGDLDCGGAKFNAQRDKGGRFGDAFSADGLEAKGGAFLRGVEAQGVVRLLGAKLGGVLDCDGAKFNALRDKDGRFGDAFSADGLDAKGNASFDSAVARGEVRMLGAKLGGDLVCVGAKFNALRGNDGRFGDAFSADRLEAGGSFFLREGARVRGRISLGGGAGGGVE